MWFLGTRRLFSRGGDITWIAPSAIVACRYPRTNRALERLADLGITLLVNLHERPHPPQTLLRLGLRELHLPVADFTPPSPEQLQTGVIMMTDAIAAGQFVAVHCGAGLGRTGTLLACYLVSQGELPEVAIARIRSLRPGAIETSAQEQAVHAYALASRMEVKGDISSCHCRSRA